MNQGEKQEAGQNTAQGQYQFQKQEQQQQTQQRKEPAQKKQFSFSFSEEKQLDNELRKPRSRAYMEVFDAVDMLSSTDEEIMEKLKANMDEETAEAFSTMTAEEIMEEMMLCFREEFEQLAIEMKSILQGVLAKCYINGCDCHAISSEGRIIDHFQTGTALPENLAKGRIVFQKYPDCRCVEVYTDCCRVVKDDSTVVKITNNEIKEL